MALTTSVVVDDNVAGVMNRVIAIEPLGLEDQDTGGILGCVARSAEDAEAALTEAQSRLQGSFWQGEVQANQRLRRKLALFGRDLSLIPVRDAASGLTCELARSEIFRDKGLAAAVTNADRLYAATSELALLESLTHWDSSAARHLRDEAPTRLALDAYERAYASSQASLAGAV